MKDKPHQYQTAGPITAAQFDNFILASITIASMKAAAMVLENHARMMRERKRGAK